MGGGGGDPKGSPIEEPPFTRRQFQAVSTRRHIHREGSSILSSNEMYTHPSQEPLNPFNPNTSFLIVLPCFLVLFSLSLGKACFFTWFSCRLIKVVSSVLLSVGCTSAVLSVASSLVVGILCHPSPDWARVGSPGLFSECWYQVVPWVQSYNLFCQVKVHHGVHHARLG